MNQNFKMRIVGICGLKRSGKDTVADHLVSNYGYTKIKFASSLKSACRELFGFTEEQMETDEKEIVDPVWNISPRKALQYIGTEIMQHKINELIPGTGRLFWVKKIMHEIQKSPNNRFVLSDLRFMHEYDYLKQYYGNQFQVIKISKINLDLQDDMHISEQEWCRIPHDFLIDNDSSRELLYKTIDSLLNRS